MTTINASSEVYEMILKQRHKMEEETGEIVPISHALDALLGIRKKVKK